jgi:hypothetical protein
MVPSQAMVCERRSYECLVTPGSRASRNGVANDSLLRWTFLFQVRPNGLGRTDTASGARAIFFVALTHEECQCGDHQSNPATVVQQNSHIGRTVSLARNAESLKVDAVFLAHRTANFLRFG